MPGKEYRSFRNVKLMFKHFGGDTTYDSDGIRHFAMILPDKEMAEELAENNWNVREYSRDEDEDPIYYVDIKIGQYAKIFLVTEHGEEQLDEAEYRMIDSSAILRCDLTAVSRYYEVAGRTGWAAYLNTMYVALKKDPAAFTYEDLLEAGGPLDDPEHLPF